MRPGGGEGALAFFLFFLGGIVRLRTKEAVRDAPDASADCPGCAGKFGGIRRDHRGVPLKEEAETRADAFVRLS